MAISERSIQAIRDISITDVVGKYVKLVKNKGCCPFHDEKTPSFSVNPRKNSFKCFGCGVGGDGIAFVERHDRLSFHETLERLARDHNIAIEYEDSFTPEHRKEHQDKMDVYRQILNYAFDYYRKALSTNLQVKKYLMDRAIDDDVIDEWQLGFAPDAWQGVTPGIIERGWYDPALQIGIIGTTDGKNYDMYRNRVIIPLRDRQGQLIGFAGRVIDNSQPKYINPKESEVYTKSNLWFGWDSAIKTIASDRNVYVVEGYFDVISMQRRGLANTIASCGTAIDDKQWKLLKPHTPTVSLMYDGDKAGQEKVMKHTLAALKQGFHVQYIELIEGIDPDEWARSIGADEPEEVNA